MISGSRHRAPSLAVVFIGSQDIRNLPGGSLRLRARFVRSILRGPDSSGSGPLYITVSPYLAARARFLPSSARGIPPEKPLDPAENTRVYVNYGNCRNVGKAAKKPRGRGG